MASRLKIGVLKIGVLKAEQPTMDGARAEALAKWDPGRPLEAPTEPWKERLWAGKLQAGRGLQ